MNSVIRNRTLTCLLLAFSFSTYLAISAQAQGGPPWPPFELKQESDGLYTFQVGARRNLVLIGSEGVIITDPVNEETAKIYRDEIAKVTDKPIKYVVYSSSLWGRIRGGRVFKAEGAQIVAHEMCAQELKDTPHPDVVMPDITFTDKFNISVGDVSLDLVHLGANYGTCSPVMIAQPANMMFLVNIVNPPYAQVPWDPTIPNFHLHNLIPFFHAVEDYAAEYKIKSVMGAYMSVERIRLISDGNLAQEDADWALDGLAESGLGGPGKTSGMSMIRDGGPASSQRTRIWHVVPVGGEPVIVISAFRTGE